MSGPVHFEAPSALDFFAALVVDDRSLPLLEAAIAVAQDDMPQLDIQGVLDEVDTLAQRLCRRLPADAPPLQRLRLLNPYFFHELGFAGNVNDYYDPANSLVPQVLATRRGIPITLALLYMEMAQRAGLQAAGVCFPGHFLVKLSLPSAGRMVEVVIDPYSGQSLTREDLEERLLPFRRQLHSQGADAAEMTLGSWLQPATARDILTRLLRNLKEVHRSANDLPRLAAVLRRLVIVQPLLGAERRELAVVLARLGRHAEAADELAAYLQHRPDAGEVLKLREELAQWRRAH
jgi:regulator of sirC expression with transglutaminase-like and TPR domain